MSTASVFRKSENYLPIFSSNSSLAFFKNSNSLFYQELIWVYGMIEEITSYPKQLISWLCKNIFLFSLIFLLLSYTYFTSYMCQGYSCNTVSCSACPLLDHLHPVFIYLIWWFCLVSCRMTVLHLCLFQKYSLSVTAYFSS